MGVKEIGEKLILREEFEMAVKELKHNKAMGIKNICVEMLSVMRGKGKETLFRIVISAYEKRLANLI